MTAMQGGSTSTAYGAVALAVLAPSSASLAQSDTATIVVTGERVARSVMKTDSSVSVLSADRIAATAGADRLEQILTLTPNLQLGSGGEGPTIRGQDTNGALRDMPAFLGGNRPRVTLQLDGRPVSYNELAFGAAPLWDVERIEVFRSPQSTTQGRNSIAGAIFVETSAPSFDWQARGRLTEGDFHTHQQSALLSGPIIDDQLAFRLAGDRRRSSPSSRLISSALGIDYNRDDYDVVRFKLLATPEAISGLRLTAIVSHNLSRAPQVEGIRKPFEARRDPNATYGFFRVRVDALTLRGAYQPAANWGLTALATFGDASVRRFAPPGFGEAMVAGRDSSIELVANWAPSESLKLVAGVNDTAARLNQTIDLRAAALGRGAFRDRQRATGLFGQAEWALHPRIKLTAGARFQHDHQVRTGTLGIGGANPLGLAFDQSYAEFLPKLAVSYELSNSLRVGAQVQRAYNPGGVTLDTRRRVVDTFDRESLWSYEGFVRGSLAQSRIDLSANIFYYDIRDAQRTVTTEFATPGGTVFTAEVGNVPTARSSGAEVQLDWHLTTRMTIQASLGLLSTRVISTLSPSDPLLGKEFQRSPHFTGAIAFDWRPADAVRLTGQIRHNSGYFSDDTNDPLRRVSGAMVADAKASWSVGPFIASAYVRNLFDRFYLTYVYTPSSGLATAGDPREIGASFEMRF